MKNLQITAYTQSFIRQQVMPGDICIDATMGNGNDTALLSRLAGEKGHVLAFDIQKQALEHTEERLKKDNCPENYRLILDSHENMAMQKWKPYPVSPLIWDIFQEETIRWQPERTAANGQWKAALHF